MNLTIMLIGLLVIAIFLLPFYFVVRTSKNNEKHDLLTGAKTPDDATVKKRAAH
jgi:hypothetical protein